MLLNGKTQWPKRRDSKREHAQKSINILIIGFKNILKKICFKINFYVLFIEKNIQSISTYEAPIKWGYK